jgi:hypothetical protein
MLSALPAQAYKKKAPPFLMVEVETRDGETLKGQLYFEKLLVTLEVMDSSGKVVEKSSTLGIKSLTPMGQRSIQIRRVDDKQWSFRLVMPKAADRKLRLNMTSFPLGVMDKVNRDKVVTNGLHDAGITGLELDHRKPAAALIDAPIKLLLDKRSDLDDLPVESIKAIRFLYAGNDYKREFPTGRFVRYSKQAKGDNGTVQPVAATFCGGALGAEHFFGGGFLRDNRITVTGDFVELDFLKGVKATRIGGNDPADDAYRGDPGRDRKGRPLPSPRRAPVIVEYSSDLSKIVGVTRLPWASLYADKMVIAADDGVVLHGEPGPTFAGIEKTAGAVHTVENPDAVAYAKSKGRTPRRDSVMLKVSGDREKIDWVVRFKHGGLTFDAQPDGRLVVQRGRQIFYVQPDGKVTDGPRIDLSSSKTGVHVGWSRCATRGCTSSNPTAISTGQLTTGPGRSSVCSPCGWCRNQLSGTCAWAPTAAF